MASNSSNIVDVENELFWREVKHATKQVELNHGLTFDITRGASNASVFWAIDELKEMVDEYLVIEIREVEPKQPALLVP